MFLRIPAGRSTSTWGSFKAIAAKLQVANSSKKYSKGPTASCLLNSTFSPLHILPRMFPQLPLLHSVPSLLSCCMNVFLLYPVFLIEPNTINILVKVSISLNLSQLCPQGQAELVEGQH